MKTHKARAARKHYEAVFGELYEFQSYGDRLSCAYCGQPRYCLDHVPPISLVAKIGTKKLRELKVDLYKVPCCDFCNSALNAVRLASFEERLVYLYNYINKRLDKQTVWSEYELEEITGNLKRMIQGKQYKIKTELIARLRVIETKLAALENG